MFKRNRWNKLLANVPPSRNTPKNQANRATVESVRQVKNILLSRNPRVLSRKSSMHVRRLVRFTICLNAVATWLPL